MVGVPCAGKTTWAKKHSQYAYVGSDEIRKELYGKELTLRGRRKVHRIMLQRANEHLAAGRDVVLDSSHLSPHARRKVLQAIPKHTIAVAIYINTPIQQAIENNMKRSRNVPRIGIILSGKRLVAPTQQEGFDRIELIEAFHTTL